MDDDATARWSRIIFEIPVTAPTVAPTNDTVRVPCSRDFTDSSEYGMVPLLMIAASVFVLCVIPMCCAYRQQLRTERESPATARVRHRTPEELDPSLPEKRVPILTEALKATTCTVQAEHISQNAEKKADTCIPSTKDDNTSTDVVVYDDVSTEQASMSEDDTHQNGDHEENDIELGYEGIDENLVALPVGIHNGNRSVPGGCAICLCPYEAGDEITWSADESCQHAFHQDCIVQWLVKKSEPRCPCCRHLFCEVPDVT